ncbi:MAG: BlaI/MecI/CopY family transcriptional regulator, partial [Candidatus Nitrosocaldus sp.]
AQELNSLGERIMHLIEEEFPYGDFTSSQVLEAYEDRYNEPIKLSMVSTYLARFASKGVLARSKNGREWRYRRVMLKH